MVARVCNAFIEIVVQAQSFLEHTIKVIPHQALQQFHILPCDILKVVNVILEQRTQ